MLLHRIAPAFLVCASALYCATFGTATSIVGGAADLALDEARSRLYLVNTNLSRVEIYAIRQKAFLTPVTTDSSPISCAMSRNGKYLYVTSYDASALNVIDLDTQAVVTRVSLPARPEGVAVGIDERVLISTIGTGTGNTQSVLVLYDPAARSTDTSLISIPVTPPAPNPPTLPSPSARPFLASAAQLVASTDGTFIVGVNLPNTTTRVVFYYEVASATVLRSRTVTSASSVLAVSPDGTKFMAGLTLFDASTLQVLAQQNMANSSYPIATGTNFNTQSAQGGSVFAPDGKTLYSAFDITPVQNPAAKPSVSELMLNDPDNLLINMGLQLPENLQGKMVISKDGGNIYALSESGFLTIPMSTLSQNPLAVPDSTVIQLSNDQCGTTKPTGRVVVKNAGRGSMQVSAQLLQYTSSSVTGIGGTGGAGGGNPGGGIVIVTPGGQTTAAASTATAPSIRTSQAQDGTAVDFTYSTSSTAKAVGSVNPAHDILIQSTQAINIPNRVRVYQNYRNAESRGDVLSVSTGITDNEALVDMAYDSKRQRIYIANSGMNRVEVFDVNGKKFLTPVKVGQLPRSLALTPDSNTLYVANTGGESISIVDPDLLAVTGRVAFPAIPLNTATAIVTPSILAASERGLMFLTSTGQIWRVIGNVAEPRGISKIIGSTSAGLPLTMSTPRGIAATPGGERVIVAAGTGYVYLYDALVDDFIQARQIFSGTQTGYLGPISAGPKGAYYLVNGYVLNEALTAIYSPPSQQTSGSTATTPIPVAAVTAASATMFARFSQPIRTAAQTSSDPGTVEIVDLSSGNTLRSVTAVEAPSTQAVTGRSTTIDGRTMAIDAAGANAYLITESGLSILPLDAVSTSNRPTVPSRAVVNAASYQTAVAGNGLISVFGSNLADSGQASTVPLPTVLGGVCVTLNNNPLPLFMTSSGQINAQIPPGTTGTLPLVVRSISKKLASTSYSLTVSKYAPAVLVDPTSKQIALFHKDGTAVNTDHPAHRDEPLVMYALGLGPTTGGAVTAGNVSPTSPLAVTAEVEVFFGNPLYKEAAIIVDWSGLTPGFIGLYQLNLRVPGAHINGDALPVTIKIGSISSPTSGPLVPTVAVE